MSIKPFIIPTDPARESIIKQRMADYEWPVEMQLGADENPWAYGMDQRWLKDFCRFVIEDFKWQATVDELNRFDHFTAEIDGEICCVLPAFGGPGRPKMRPKAIGRCIP